MKTENLGYVAKWDLERALLGNMRKGCKVNDFLMLSLHSISVGSELEGNNLFYFLGQRFVSISEKKLSAPGLCFDSRLVSLLVKKQNSVGRGSVVGSEKACHN